MSSRAISCTRIRWRKVDSPGHRYARPPSLRLRRKEGQTHTRHCEVRSNLYAVQSGPAYWGLPRRASSQ